MNRLTDALRDSTPKERKARLAEQISTFCEEIELGRSDDFFHEQMKMVTVTPTYGHVLYQFSLDKINVKRYLNDVIKKSRSSLKMDVFAAMTLILDQKNSIPPSQRFYLKDDIK